MAECDSTCNSIKNMQKNMQINKRIQNQVAVTSSHYLDSLGAINIFKFQKNLVKSNAAKGVEVKHNSYARYLGKLKGEQIVKSTSSGSKNFSLVNVKGCCQ
jgi:heme oxygenase